MPSTLACRNTWPTLSRPGVSERSDRLSTSSWRPRISLIAVNAAAIGPSPVPRARALAGPGAGHPDLGRRRDAAAHHPQVAQLVLLGRVVKALVQQGEQVLVQDLALAVGQGGELPIDLGQLLLGQLVAQLAVAPLERVAARVLARAPGSSAGSPPSRAG